MRHGAAPDLLNASGVPWPIQADNEGPVLVASALEANAGDSLVGNIVRVVTSGWLRSVPCQQEFEYAVRDLETLDVLNQAQEGPERVRILALDG